MPLLENETTDDTTAIETLRNKTNTALTARDLQPVLHIWKENVHITRGNGRFLSGRQAMIEVFIKDFADASFLSYWRTPEKIIISRHKTTASEQGNWEATHIQNDRPVQTTGVYVAMWTKEEGIWQIQAELYIALADTAVE